MIAYFQLFRLGNALTAAVAVLVGAWLVAPFWDSVYIVCAAISALFIVAGANASNDAYDIAADRINRPQRPLPLEKIPLKNAKQAGFSLTMFGIGTGFLLPAPKMLLPLFCALLLWRYNVSWKRRAWIGNLTIALCGALTPMFGAWVAGDGSKGIIPAILVGFAFFAREVAKDIQDIPGDAAAGYRTAAIAFGVQAAKSSIRYATLGLLATLTLLFTIASFQNLLSQTLIAFVIGLGINRFIMISRLKTNEPSAWAKVSGWYKEILILGLLVLTSGHVSG